MAVVKVIENILENKPRVLSADAGVTIEEIIRSNALGDDYSGTMVECYDCDTGETFYAPIEDGDAASVAVLVNGSDKPLDYAVAEGDSVELIFLPMSSDSWDWWGALGGIFVGALTGGLYGGSLGGGIFSWATAGIGAIIGGVIGFFAGGLITPYVKNMLNPDEKNGNHTKGIDSDNLPDVRGSQNTPLTDNVFPAVMGKHLTTPFIIGSTYNEIYGEYGTENYIHALYLVGYAPLRISDLKLGEQLLAHNQSWSGNESMENVFHGRLEGTDSTDDTDTGDIVSTWHSNDIAVEILQQGQDGEEIDWGEIYPYAKIQDDINANVLYILDKTTEEKPLVSYKGLSLANGLRNNPVRFTRQCPLSARIELNFQNGLYKTRSEKSGDNSVVAYGKIPLWVAMQWRVYSDENDASDGDKSGVIDGEMTPTSGDYWWDAENGTQRTARRGWHSFSSLNGSGETISMNFSANGSVTMTQADYHGSNGDSKVVTVSYSGMVSVTMSVDKPFSENTVMSALAKITTTCTASYLYKSHYNKRTGQWERDRWYSQNENHQIPVTAKAQISAVLKAGEKSVTVEFPVKNSGRWVKESAKDGYSSASGTYNLKDFSVTGYSTTVTGTISDVSFAGSKIADSLDTDSYTSTLSSFNFTSLKTKELTRKQGILVSSYTSVLRDKDRLAHTGNNITASEYAKINTKWLDESAFNLEPLGGTWDEQEGINEFRVVSEVNFVQWARANFTYSDEEDFIRKFRAYFLPSANTTKSIEVRVVRLSPNYLNETVSTSDYSAYSFNDVFSWKTLTSTMFDEDELIKNKRIVQKRPLSESDMRKHCVIAIKAKTDNTDQLSTTLRKFTCMAQGFAPYYDSDLKQWFPKEVNPVTRYYKPNGEDGTRGAEITEEQFIADRQGDPQMKSLRRKAGNDFVKNLVTKVIRTSGNLDSRGRYVIPRGYTVGDDGEVWDDTYIEDAGGNKLWNKNAIRYCENNVASMMLWAGIGAHMGINALSYSDYDLASLARVFEFCKSVKDGSTYNSDGWHYDHYGEAVYHNEGEDVEMYFTANGYIYEAKKLEDVLSSLSIAARCVYTRNRANRLTFIVDKEEPYHVALINQSNTLSSSYSISYADLPSALMIPFKDENDGFQTNNIYAWADGETKDDYRGVIEQYKLDYITNPYHIWSIGRYLLANRLMNREVVTKKIGMEGYSIGLGNIVCVQDDTMLIGDDHGGRITRLIEDGGYIYGFIIDRTYRFTGETDADGLVRKGVVVMQPSQYKESRVLTLRLAPLGTLCEVYVDGKPFVVRKGDTNVVILKDKLSKGGTEEGGVSYVYSPQEGNIVGFGEVGKETALYRVLRIKPDNKHNYELTLLKYQKELYNYGKRLPSFQNNISRKTESGDSYDLSSAASTADLASAIQQASEITVAKGLSIVAPNGTVFKNGKPDALTLESVENGFTAVSWQWSKDGSDIDGATERTLTVPASGVGATGAGVYKCVAKSETASFYAYITLSSVSDGVSRILTSLLEDGTDGEMAVYMGAFFVYRETEHAWVRLDGSMYLGVLDGEPEGANIDSFYLQSAALRDYVLELSDGTNLELSDGTELELRSGHVEGWIFYLDETGWHRDGNRNSWRYMVAFNDLAANGWELSPNYDAYLASKMTEEVADKTPRYHGAVFSVPTEANEGDWLTWAKEGVSGFEVGRVYRASVTNGTVTWTALDENDTANAKELMTALNDLLTLNNAQVGYFSTIFANALMANEAFFNSLTAKVAEIGKLKSGEITVKVAETADTATNATNATNSTNVAGGTVSGMTTDASKANEVAIHSSDWDVSKKGSNTTGFGIMKNGDAYFNKGSFRGNIEATSGSFSGEINAISGTFSGYITQGYKSYKSCYVAFYDNNTDECPIMYKSSNVNKVYKLNTSGDYMIEFNALKYPGKDGSFLSCPVIGTLLFASDSVRTYHAQTGYPMPNINYRINGMLSNSPSSFSYYKDSLTEVNDFFNPFRLLQASRPDFTINITLASGTTKTFYKTNNYYGFMHFTDFNTDNAANVTGGAMWLFDEVNA